MAHNASNNRSEHGSAHVWIIVLLIVIILGLLGVVFWQQITKTETVTTVESPQTESTTQPSSQFNTYTSDDAGTYVKTFEYPKEWAVISNEAICEDFNVCMSPPALMLADQDTIKLQLDLPQSGSMNTIDEEASSLAAADNGTVDSDFTAIDGVAARKIEYPTGKVHIIIELRGGYGQLEFLNGTTSEEIEMVVSSWRWA